MTKKTFLLLFLMLLTTYSFASNLDEPTQIRETLHDSDKTIKDFRISVGGGYARRLGKTENMNDATFNKLLDKITNQTYFEMDGQYFFKESWGLGLVVNNASKSAEVNHVILKTNFLYVGPTFSMRFDLDKFLVLWNVGLGPLFYNEKLEGVLGGTLDKTALGFQTSASGEYKLSKSFGIGLKLGWISGYTEIKDSNNKNYRMNLSNFNIGTYLSFRTW